MTRLSLFVLVLLFSLNLQAQVYRCDSADGPVYSQMPCSENAERLPAYDPAVDTVEAEPVPSTVKQPTAMENFVMTLHRQRQQQMSEMDARISQLQSQIDATGEQAPDASQISDLRAELVVVQSERLSISDQYATLISEAERRAGSNNMGN